MSDSLEKIVSEFEELMKKLDGWCDYYASERPDQENLSEGHDKLISGTKLVARSWRTDLLMLQVSLMLANLEDMVTNK